jgi:phage FluMu gp28-like protein
MQINIAAPTLTEYQKAIINSLARFTVTEASTKTGKTFSHIYWLFKEAHKDYNKPGYNHWWIAPVYSQAEIAFNRMCRKIKGNNLYKINISKLSILTPIGTIIWFKSADKPDNLYGDDVYSCVFDEFTRARETAWHAIRSTLTATKGKCKFIGNAKGTKNWGHKLGQRAKNGATDWEYFKITAYDAVKAGVLELEEVESARQDLPERVFKELYLAEASEEGTTPFGLNHIAKCVRELSDKPAEWFGVDLAKSYDYTVIIGLDEDGMICHFERFQKDWTQTRRRVIEVVGDLPAMVDSTGVGDPIVEDMQKDCTNMQGFKYSEQSKQKLIEGLVMAIQDGSTSVLDNEHRYEMEQFEFVYTHRSVKYSAPDGEHDDTVNAHALAIKAKNEIKALDYQW